MKLREFAETPPVTVSKPPANFTRSPMAFTEQENHEIYNEEEFL